MMDVGSIQHMYEWWMLQFTTGSTCKFLSCEKIYLINVSPNINLHHFIQQPNALLFLHKIYILVAICQIYGYNLKPFNLLTNNSIFCLSRTLTTSLHGL